MICCIGCMYVYQMFTWGWNQRGTLGHPPETKTENIPSHVKALANVKIVQVITICLNLDSNIEQVVLLDGDL